MTIKELREIYEDSSTKASDINRKLVFAGIAIVWIFRVTECSTLEHIIPDNLKHVLLLLCISLCIDISQYIVRGIIWHIYYYFKKDPQTSEDQVQAEEPEWLNAIPDSFWYSKFIPTFFAYLSLANYLSITPSQHLSWIIRFSGWSILYWVGIMFGILTLWYAITECFQKKEKECTIRSIVCILLRSIVGLAAIFICLINFFS